MLKIKQGNGYLNTNEQKSNIRISIYAGALPLVSVDDVRGIQVTLILECVTVSCKC